MTMWWIFLLCYANEVVAFMRADGGVLNETCYLYIYVELFIVFVLLGFAATILFCFFGGMNLTFKYPNWSCFV